jgi:glucose uptake protein GlcU
MLFQTALMTTLGLIALVVITIDAVLTRRKDRKAK